MGGNNGNQIGIVRYSIVNNGSYKQYLYYVIRSLFLVTAMPLNDFIVNQQKIAPKILDPLKSIYN